MKHPGGRPKEPFVPWDNWHDDVLELYGVGASDVEVRGLIIDKMGRNYLSFGLWERWIEEEDEFSQTIKMGRILSEIWWQKSGRTGLKDREFNYTGWYMNMKNRFGWKDKQEIEHGVHGSKDMEWRVTYKTPKKQEPE